MNSSRPTKKKSGLKLQKISIFLLAFLISFSCFYTVKRVFAQMPVYVAADPTVTAPIIYKNVLDKVWQTLTKVLKKAGSIAFQRTLSTALNKIAYDTATYIGSGGEGQKPLFVKQELGDYLTQIGDEAMGTFVESFVNNLNTAGTAGTEDCSAALQRCQKDCRDRYSSAMLAGGATGATAADSATFNTCNKECDKQTTSCVSATTEANVASTAAALKATPSFNVCQPSSLEAKLRIGLGLVEQSRPQGPNCTASQMIKNWGEDITKKWEDLQDPDFLDNFANIFNPASNDVGIYFLARTDLSSKAIIDTEHGKDAYITSSGWLENRDIAGNLAGIPGQAERELKTAQDVQAGNIGKITGDVLVDAANVFLNQLTISAFNNLMQNLGKKTSDSSKTSYGGYEDDPGIAYGESAVKEITSELLKPKFGTQSDYDILSVLAVCLDAENPGPTNCVIDDKLMQGISEKKTVAEAINAGYLHRDWQLTADNGGDSYMNSYSLRNISILRKYRILPVGWEMAANKITALNKQREETNKSRPNNDQLPLIKATLLDMVSCFDSNDQYNQFSSDFETRDQGWCQDLIDPNWVLKAPLNYCKKEGVSAQILDKTVIPGTKGQTGVAGTLGEINVVRADGYCADEQTCIKEKSDGSCEAYGYCNEEKRTWNFGKDSCQPIYNTCQSFTNTDTGQSVSYLENTLNYGNCNRENAGCHQYSLSGAYATTTGTVSWDSSKSLYLNKNLGACDNKDEGCTELMRVKPTWGSNLIMDSDFGNEEVGETTTGSALNDWPLINTSRATIVEASQDPGDGSGKALKLEIAGTSGGLSSASSSLLPTNLQIIPGQSYTVSVDVYLKQGNSVSLYLGAAATEGFVKTTMEKNSWQHLSVTRPAVSAYNEPNFGLSVNGASGLFYFKNLKFEISDWDTGYSPYGSFKVYEKLLPPYLEKSCYTDATSASKDYSLKTDAPSVCSNYARKCNKDEVGCELYTSAEDNFSIPAKVTNYDYCPEQCLGYDVYISKGSYFNSPQAENLIPKKSTACSADAAGCSEFTNLDILAQGGERKEYYTSLKQCIKPSVDCANFYSWEGTEGGYQLKAYNLKKNVNGLPATTFDNITSESACASAGGYWNVNVCDDSNLCSAAIYNLPISDPAFNPDCREFYNAAGQVAYHLNSRTITCSDNCHAYRLSEKNINKDLISSAACDDVNNSNRHWDIAAGVCYVCLNGGAWNTTHNACVYQAIPGEGKTCRASENGCREYNGNSGNNIRLAAYYDFENGLNGWHSNCSDGVSVSAISNNKNGHSLQYNNSVPDCGTAIGDKAGTYAKRLIEQILASGNVAAQLKVGTTVNSGSAYSIKFLGRAAADVNLKIYFLNKDNGTSATAPFTDVTIKGGGDWDIYQANLDNLNHTVSSNEILVITANDNFFLDDFILTEITDRYYLIKNSSQIPDICYYDIFDNYRGSDYNLGCSQYTDRDNLKHNLHKFTKLCSDSAVGCEQMINTKNYTPYGAGIWNDDNGDEVSDSTDNNGTCDLNEPDCVQVPGDSALYAIYDASKQCNVADLGCSRLGQGQGGTTVTSWSDVYKKNNPNKYSQILCGRDKVGCEEWQSTTDNSLSYFKNPGSSVCLYRASTNPTIPGKAWYKLPVKRCDANGDGQINGVEIGSAVCTSDSNCGGQRCIIDNNDYPCSVSYFKTIGPGGAGNQIPTPDQDAGLCETNASGCTEYIDPVSQFAANLIYNPSFQLISDAREGWGTTTPEIWNNQSLATTSQVIQLKLNKLYSLTTKPNGKDGSLNGDVGLEFLSGVKPLLTITTGDANDNNICDAGETNCVINNTFGATTKNLKIINGTNQPIIFYSLNNSKALLTGGNVNKTIEIKELVVDYQLRSNIDKKSCNGLVKFDNGCILFNERSVNGASGVASLSSGWDAAASKDGAAPVLCKSDIAGSCTANQLIKVRPDRACAKWLDCVTYGLDSAGQKICYAIGECDQLNDKNECGNFLTSSVATHNFNAGNDKNSTGYSLLDKYYLGNMKEVGVNTDAHFDFEDADISLSCKPVKGTTCSFDQNLNADLLVLEPDNAPTDYPAHGRGYLKVPGNYKISPLPDTSYTRVYAGPDANNPRYYYINYLVNTKDSGTKAKVIIEANSASAPNTFTTLTSFTDEAVNGWERKVHRFYIIGTGERHIKIRLTSDSGEEKYVYFDDINIEPVLKIGDNKKPDGADDENKNYAAKDCRLYPEADSLSCSSYNNNVVADGLYGYCLQYDPLNPSVCAMWYPIDKISSISKNSASGLGYKGKFPLYYCTEADGDWQLVEKVKAVKVDQWKQDYTGGCKDGSCTWEGTYVPDENKRRCTNCKGEKNEYGGSYYGYANKEGCELKCGDCNKYSLFVTVRSYCDQISLRKKYYCVPKTDNAVMPSEMIKLKNLKDVGFTDEESQCDYEIPLSAWVPYNGFFYKAKQARCTDSDCADINEAKNFTPPVAIYEPGTQGEDDLKLVSGSDPEKVFRIQCNRFAQLVDSEGNNKAWADRVSRNSTYPEATPPFFQSPYYPSQILKYGRNREDVPFGAAVFPSDFSLSGQPSIYLRNQYSSKSNETTLAGRPYGCTNLGTGCSNIGQCSLNPNVFCIYSSINDAAYDINQKSCAAGGYGTCVPLWTTPLRTKTQTDSDSQKILKNLFFEQYSYYEYFPSDKKYQSSTPESKFNWYNNIPDPCNGNGSARSGDTFCAVYPTINIISPANGAINAVNGGIYRLTFTTTVDKEQQPLRQIVIDWGDGNIQVITGEDSRTLASDPHLFYHYYTKGNYNIEIKVVDNWESYKCKPVVSSLCQ